MNTTTTTTTLTVNKLPVTNQGDTHKHTLRALHRSGLSLPDIMANCPRVAITGTRASTAYGDQVASDLIDLCIRERMTVITSASAGIDAAVRGGNLTWGGGAPIVVTAGGLNTNPLRFGPGRDAIIGSGGVILSVSANDDQVATRSGSELVRRVIAYLCHACLIVEAASRSAVLDQVTYTEQLGKPIGAVPGPITSMASAGCHELISTGRAKIIADDEDAVDLVLGEMYA